MNNIYDAIINKSKPAMYLDKDNKCAGFDDFDIAVMSGRAFCCDMVQEVIPVDIDATELPYLQEFRTLIQQSGYAYIEVMSGGDMSDNRHFYIYIDQNNPPTLINDIKMVGNSILFHRSPFSSGFSYQIYLKV